MSLNRLLLRRTTTTTTANPILRTLYYFFPFPQSPNPNPPISTSLLLPSSRTFAFSSAEEAAAERRRRKRRLRIEPPLHAIQSRNPNPPPRDPNAPRLPDSTNALVGPRLNLHNRVQALIRAFDLDTASHVARNSVYTRTRPTVFTCNAIIAAMYRDKRYEDAVALFKYFFEQHNIVPNIVSYNYLINVYCDDGKVDVGLEVYRKIIEVAPFGPSPVTYKHLTKGLIDAGRIGDAVDLLREMLAKGHGADSLVYNNVIKGFLDLGNLEKANEFFDELKERCLVYDGVIHATFMEWWFKQGKDREAMESYKSLLEKDFKMIPVTCNVLLEVLIKYAKKETAWALFERMLDNHTPPNFHAVNSETFNIMVNECFNEGKVAEAVETFRKVGTKEKSRPFSMDVAGYNNIIARFCENGMMEEAENFFKTLSEKCLNPDVTTFRTLINSYLKLDRIDDVLRMFDKMADSGLRVVANYGTMVFGELIKNGKAVESAEILTKMGNKDPKPDPSIYDVVVRGLCDTGALDLSKDILDQMVKYGVGLPPALKGFVLEAFENAGRGSEIKSVFDESRRINNSRPTYPRQPHSQYAGNPNVGEPLIARSQSFGNHPMPGQTQSGSPLLTRQQPLGSYNTELQQPARPYQGYQSSSSFPHGGQPPSWSSQVEGRQQSQYSQAGEQQPSWSSQTREQQSCFSQTGGQQPSWSSQTREQQSWSSQTGGQQPSWSSQTSRQQPSWSSQTRGQQPSMSFDRGGQPSSLPSQTGGQQASWSCNMDQQPSGTSHMTGQQQIESSQMSREFPFGSLQNTGQCSYGSPSEVGHHPAKPSHGQHQWQEQDNQQSSETSHMTRQQPSGTSNITRQQPNESPWMSGQLPFGSSQNTGRYSYGLPSEVGYHPVEPSGQRQWQEQENQQQFYPMAGHQANGPAEMVGQQSSGPLEWQGSHRQAAG